ncbi:AcrR family transcriptional regulator [Allocatelliglobosispora scoriae]|uniref:AcrR family transcriptional regulator n=1 Tax=Allocatelliglobosispora scoriae TaxID=643052 RepID=A0A841C3E3_9ACTN|nr:TetR/AcrR family transcriptional regulator [Allocatelliglobosispora scoriae]MBB5873572.1 AcrR family transcriptional regulator [Allocatelliglobosispora scoriae]
MTTAKPLRADAQRNRARLLEAAEAVFAGSGAGASTEEVARVAGVGIGTVFRHFPTKEALLEAVYVGRLERFAAEAEELTSSVDPVAALLGFFTRTVQQAATKNALAEALSAAGVSTEHANSTAGTALRTALTTLLDRAQRAGGVRSDIGIGDLVGLMIGASHAVSGKDDAARDRIIAVVVDGLSARR